MQTWNLAPRMLVEWKYKIEDTFQRRRPPPHTLPLQTLENGRGKKQGSETDVEKRMTQKGNETVGDTTILGIIQDKEKARVPPSRNGKGLLGKKPPKNIPALLRRAVSLKTHSLVAMPTDSSLELGRTIRKWRRCSQRVTPKTTDPGCQKPNRSSWSLDGAA